MKNFKNRFLRVMVALSLATLIASQIPVRGVSALAQDEYTNTDDDNSGNFLGINGLSNRDVIQASVFGLVAYGIVSTLKGNIGTGAAAAAGPRPQVAVLGDKTKPIWDVTFDDGSTDRFQTVTRGAEKAGVKEIPLRDQENKPYTFFVPTDEAMRAFSDELAQEIMSDGVLSPPSQEKVKNLIMYHTVKGEFKIMDLIDQAEKAGGKIEIANLANAPLAVTYKDGILKVNDVPVLLEDIESNNGVSHPIETVLSMPNSPAPATN